MDQAGKIPGLGPYDETDLSGFEMLLLVVSGVLGCSNASMSGSCFWADTAVSH